ncbi:hypothetical protein [Corynebacterium lehmanniae]
MKNVIASDISVFFACPSIGVNIGLTGFLDSGILRNRVRSRGLNSSQKREVDTRAKQVVGALIKRFRHFSVNFRLIPHNDIHLRNDLGARAVRFTPAGTDLVVVAISPRHLRHRHTTDAQRHRAYYRGDAAPPATLLLFFAHPCPPHQ